MANTSNRLFNFTPEQQRGLFEACMHAIASIRANKITLPVTESILLRAANNADPELASEILSEIEAENKARAATSDVFKRLGELFNPSRTPALDTIERQLHD